MVSKASSDKLSCSFCGKTQDDVKKLIAGPSVYICNECVDLCNDIIEEEIKSEEDTSLEFHGLKAGMYIIVLKTPNETSVFKWMKL